MGPYAFSPYCPEAQWYSLAVTLTSFIGSSLCSPSPTKSRWSQRFWLQHSENSVPEVVAAGLPPAHQPFSAAPSNCHHGRWLVFFCTSESCWSFTRGFTPASRWKYGNPCCPLVALPALLDPDLQLATRDPPHLSAPVPLLRVSWLVRVPIARPRCYLAGLTLPHRPGRLGAPARVVHCIVWYGEPFFQRGSLFSDPR